MHSFHAYIDESGDDGFVFADPPERKSSEWFVLSACVVRSSNHSLASDKLRAIIDPIEQRRGSPIHFHRLHHEQRVAIAHALAKLPIKTVTVCINKRRLQPGHTLSGDKRLYRYVARYLLERVSWLARDWSSSSPGDGRCRLHFSKSKGLSYAELREYVERLGGELTSISWAHLDTTGFSIKAHADSAWLRAADAICTSFARGLELSEHGFCEERYARLLHRVVYSRGGKYASYGLKVFPDRPPVEEWRDNRYQWLSMYE